jgi:hypothetical protein
MAFDVRAMENIATAPASPADRLTAAWLAVAILATFAAVLPFSDMRLPTTAAYVPALMSAAILAQILTALLFYLQYRLVRQSRLALLALAYASSAVLTAFYTLTFPGVFSLGGLFSASLQTAAWIAIAERFTFDVLLIAFALADRFSWQSTRRHVRLIGAAVALWTFGAIVCTIVLPLPVLIDGTHATGLFFMFWCRSTLPQRLSRSLYWPRAGCARSRKFG